MNDWSKKIEISMSVIVIILPFWIWDFMCVHCVLITLFAVWRNNSMYSNVTIWLILRVQ